MSGASKRTAVIMQPTYLPYLGYFHLIAQADVFVFLDDVQFARRSWQSRNRILGAGGEVMLTVPTTKADRDTAIADIGISDAEPWRRQAPRVDPPRLRQAAVLRRRDGLPGSAAGIAARKAGRSQRGPDRRRQRPKLGLTTEFVRASRLSVAGHRSDHLLAACRAVGATDYLSPMGSADYMAEDGVFTAAAFPVRFQRFVEIAYPQGHEPFTPYMAFIDAVMNLGWSGTRALIDAMDPT